MGKWLGTWMDDRVDGYLSGWTDGSMDVWMGAQIDGWINEVCVSHLEKQ